MQNTLSRIAVGLTALASLVAIATPTLAGGPLLRLDANWNYFGFEASTLNDADNPTALTGGTAVYTKVVFVPAGANTIYVTMSTTGDGHDGAASCFTALVDGAFFNAGTQGAAACADGDLAPPTQVGGWVNLLKTPAGGGAVNCNDGGGGDGDCHDNGIYYTWCTPITPGTHTVEVRMATDTQNSVVFIEQAFFYVDASFIKGSNRCVQTPVPIL